MNRSTNNIIRAGVVAGLLLSISVAAISQQKKWMIDSFQKQDAVNPCLFPLKTTFTEPVANKKVAWEIKDVFNPAAIVRNNKIYLLYRAQDDVGKPAGTSRIGLAYSADGLHFKRWPRPVLYPDKDEFHRFEWQGGCEDPRIVEDDNGIYYMTYTAYDGSTARLFIATSKDLVHWKKHGSVFKKTGDARLINLWSKSGSIVCNRSGSKLTAARINGKYWMYWGDINIYIAVSDNLIDWTPLYETPLEKNTADPLDSGKSFKVLLSPRKKRFDSELVEPGPPGIVTQDGIVFMYNSMNSGEYGDKNLPAGVYAAGQVLIDKNDPSKLLDRSEHYFLKPDRKYEITGQVNNVCFVEGLVFFHSRWYIYYGTADSKIAVAASAVHKK